LARIDKTVGPAPPSPRSAAARIRRRMACIAMISPYFRSRTVLPGPACWTVPAAGG